MQQYETFVVAEISINRINIGYLYRLFWDICCCGHQRTTDRVIQKERSTELNQDPFKPTAS